LGKHMKPFEIIIRHLLKTNCATYNELKELLKQNSYKPDGIYEYVKHIKRKNYVILLKMGRKKVVCINEGVKREIELLVKLFSK